MKSSNFFIFAGLREKDYREKDYLLVNIVKKTFSSQHNLLQHQKRIHTGEKLYPCEFCEKSFTARSHLKTHRRIHTREKPYACEFCEKSFTQSSTLKSHRRIHTGEKPFGCDSCDKRFSDRKSLRHHKTSHTILGF